MTFDKLSPSCPEQDGGVFIVCTSSSRRMSSSSSSKLKLKGRRISMSWWVSTLYTKTSNIWCEWDFFFLFLYRHKVTHFCDVRYWIFLVSLSSEFLCNVNLSCTWLLDLGNIRLQCCNDFFYHFYFILCNLM